LLRHRGLRWLREVRWSVTSAVLDGELDSGDAMEGIDGILLARQQPSGPVAFGPSTCWRCDQEVMSEPWTDRR
jgi:hypothetical protein